MDEPKLELKNMWGHFLTINKHKWEVAKACFKAGLYRQGITHDLSKFSPSEFFTSARYYKQGVSSPVFEERDAHDGASYVEQHHHGHNPHHWEYWIHVNFKGKPIKIPPKYVREMVCDFIGAGKVYRKKDWTRSLPLEYTQDALARKNRLYHYATEELLLRLLTDFKDIGFDAIKAPHAHKVLKEIDYATAPEVDYDGKSIADLEFDFVGENRKKEIEAPVVDLSQTAEKVPESVRQNGLYGRGRTDEGPLPITKDAPSADRAIK